MITVGVQWSDVVSGFFSHRVDPSRTVALDLASASVAGRRFPAVPLIEALAALTEILGPGEVGAATWPTDEPASGAGTMPEVQVPVAPSGPKPLTQAALWTAVQAWLPRGCTLVTDIGTAFWGVVGIALPPDTAFIAQPTWSAIGYALPATLGAGLAEPGRRPVLITGEGAAMMTAPELSTLAARLPGAVVLVIENSGYTIERLLRSPQAAHHDVPRWDWTALASALAPDAVPLTFRVTTRPELVTALQAAATATDRLTLVQAVTAPLDAPPLLHTLASLVQR